MASAKKSAALAQPASTTKTHEPAGTKGQTRPPATAPDVLPTTTPATSSLKRVLQSVFAQRGTSTVPGAKQTVTSPQSSATGPAVPRPPVATPYTVEQYFAEDYPHTLFPLKTTQILVESFSSKLRDFTYNKLLTDSSSATGFLVQQRCYAAKRAYNLRRTVKLDPIAEFFIYDVVFRNKKHFRKDHRSQRQSFGYRFVDGRPETTAGAYGAYKSALANARTTHGMTLKADVATYFNAIYHHDMVNAMREIGWAEPDVDALGKFLREINAGRSIDCLPQGIHPTKALGSEFLRFIDNSYRLKAAHGVRFLDDIHLFDDSEQKLTFDLITLQELLGERGLSLNDTKTSLGHVSEVDIPAKVDRIKQSLLRIRRKAVTAYFDDDDDADMLEAPHLDKRQTEYLLNLLQTPDIDESDAELVPERVNTNETASSKVL